jgi:hypothetical protein
MYNIGERMRKGLVYILFALIFFSLLTINMIKAPSGTAVSTNPVLIQDAQLKPSAPDVNSYPSTHNNTATVANPTYAYDKNLMTFAQITPTAITFQYFNIKVFNATTTKSYSCIDINMNYSVLVYRGYYKITLYVGSATYPLQLISTANVTTPTLRTWAGLAEPNDGLWSAADLNNLVIKLEVRKLSSTGTFTCQFKEYEAWAAIQGDGFTFNVNVADVPVAPNDLYAWQVNITFNPLVLQCVAAFEGPFLMQAGPTFTLNVNINNEDGWVVAGTALQAYDIGVSGSGRLATVTFKVIAQGNSPLAFSTEFTKLRTWNGVELVPIPHSTVDGYFRSIQGDVNGDTQVNALDLYLLGRAYGASPAPPECDFDKNDIINTADLTILKQNYG